MKQEWFETFFQGVSVELWSRVMPATVTEAEVTFLEQELGAPAGGRILDVPCGHGRHSIELARRGYRVTGIDLSEDCLAAARREPSAVDWRIGDMRALDLEPAAYDGAFCFGNSFGYLSRTDAAAFLKSLATVLKPGARFALDYGTAAESILPNLTRQRWFRVGDIFMLSENRYAAEESRLDIEYTFIRNGAIETRPASSYVTTISELRTWFEAAGFNVTAMYASTSRDPYILGSPRLLLIAEKRHS